MGVTDSSIYVMMETDSQEAIKVLYRLSGDSKFKEAKTNFYIKTNSEPQNFVHRVLLKNLNSSSKYEYKVSYNNESIDGNFIMAPKKKEAFRFAVFGDLRSNPKMHSNISNLVNTHNPQFVILTGDITFKPDYQFWKDEFWVPSFSNLVRNVPFINAVGNHEDWSENTKAFLQGPIIDEPDNGYYAINYGDIFFLVLNTEISVSKNSPQWKFAKENLEKSKSKLKIVVCHIPAFCGGGHGENKNMKLMTSELFEKNGVDLVLSGHSHFYQRNFYNGIYHLILAGGGAPLYNAEIKDYVQKTVKAHHFAIFDYDGNVLKMKVYDKDNQLIDEMNYDGGRN